MRLNHVALTVSDRPRAAAFYAAHFGLRDAVHDDEHLLILRASDGAILALSEGDSPAARLPRTSHFGFQVDDADEVLRRRSALRAAGVPETEWQDDPGMVRLQVADPDGHRVDVYAYRTPPDAAP
jgi:catechol 2,3-dioxygenase-like lactoylglutathione lyase family enzyme